jgi:hypothetical protein
MARDMEDETDQPRSRNDPQLSAPEAGPARPVGPEDADPARRDLRADIGKYVSLASFPTTPEALIDDATRNGAPEFVTSALRAMRPGMSLETTRDLWIALGLNATDRF